MNRRNLLKRGTLASAAVLLPAASALALNVEHSVAAGLLVYSGKIHAVSIGCEVHMLASIDNLGAFLDHESRRRALPYENIRAEGNILSFTHRDKSYKVENVLPEHFDARAKALS